MVVFVQMGRMVNKMLLTDNQQPYSSSDHHDHFTTKTFKAIKKNVQTAKNGRFLECVALGYTKQNPKN